jgi:hypothetical protein
MTVSGFATDSRVQKGQPTMNIPQRLLVWQTGILAFACPWSVSLSPPLPVKLVSFQNEDWPPLQSHFLMPN